MVYSILLLVLGLCNCAYGASRISPPAGALTVGSSGTYKTISAAIRAASQGDEIFIYAGTYNEAVYITTNDLTIYGQTSDTSSYTSNKVIITHGGSKANSGNDDASGTLRVHADSFKMYNIDVHNSYGIGSQALALSAYGTAQGFYGCSFVGYQDTILTDVGTQYFANSYIEGAVDYIFGQTANTYIKNTVLASVAPGAITASGPQSADVAGVYVLDSCTIQAAAKATTTLTGQVYFGRPWSQYARAVFTNCNVSDIINSAGWVAWAPTTPNTAYVVFAEYQNDGPGSSTTQRAKFSTQLDGSTASKYTISAVLGNEYTSWVDPAYL